MKSLNVIKIYILMTIIVDMSSCNENARRILNGLPSKILKRFMAYFLKSPQAKVKYDAWLCGGTIVSASYILTSAACVEDVQYLYAIVGYHKYVHIKDINTDACTSKFKKKIIMTCVPKRYKFSYINATNWAAADIALAKMESPLVLNGETPKGCSHAPEYMDINYESHYERPGTDGLILGWGHVDKYRQVTDTVDYNNPYILETAVRVVDNSVCKKHWGKKWGPVIDSNMICTSGPGNIGGDGEVIKHSPKIKECSFDPQKMKMVCKTSRRSSGKNETLPQIDDEITTDSEVRSHDKLPNQTDRGTKFEKRLHNLYGTNTSEANVERNGTRRVKRSDDRNGFCQNDHGGPLIAFVGLQMNIIGVQSMFLLNEDYQCVGPFLYTSTRCNGQFIDCVMNNGRRLGIDCSLPPEKTGFSIIKRKISWKYHPDGPAENEMKERPTLDMYSFTKSNNQRQ